MQSPCNEPKTSAFVRPKDDLSVKWCRTRYVKRDKHRHDSGENCCEKQGSVFHGEFQDFAAQRISISGSLLTGRLGVEVCRFVENVGYAISIALTKLTDGSVTCREGAQQAGVVEFAAALRDGGDDWLSGDGSGRATRSRQSRPRM